MKRIIAMLLLASVASLPTKLVLACRAIALSVSSTTCLS